MNSSEKDPHGIDQHAPGAKLDAGKTAAGVLADFNLALNAVAEVGTFGLKKYSRRGWHSVKDGQERYTDAKWRHLLAKEERDPDSGLLHLAHEAWNALAVLQLKLEGEVAQLAETPYCRLFNGMTFYCSDFSATGVAMAVIQHHSPAYGEARTAAEQQSSVAFTDSSGNTCEAILELGHTRAGMAGKLETTFYVLKVNG